MGTLAASDKRASGDHNPDLNPDVLQLDPPTLKDLEVFTAEGGGESLFQFCNHARTEGGGTLLRLRMASPWSSATRIRATQEALQTIIEHEAEFDALPAAYTVNRVQHYAREVLPMVSEIGPVEFYLGAFNLWANNDRHYLSILRGVQIGCRLITSLKNFSSKLAGITLRGELIALMAELRGLLEDPQINTLPENVNGARFWKVLRLDQLFRIHQKVRIARLLELVFEIDALMSLAEATRVNGYLMPDVSEGSLSVEAEGIVHPFVTDAVPNDVVLDADKHILFLTGPNMAGKTTYLRSFATALYMAHLGMGVPATRFSFTPAQYLFSSISLSDDLRGGISYFRAEALRVKSIALALSGGHRVVALMDEPFKGTNVKDAFDASLAILERFASRDLCLFMFSSHLIELSERLTGIERVDCRYFEAEEGEGRLKFDYRLRQGVSMQRLGMRVLEEEGVFELLDAP